MFVLFFPLAFFPPPFAVLGCQAILVSDRNKSFRRASVGQPLSPTKSSRIRSQRPLSPQPAGLGEIYCEERKKVVISWHFHDETWPKLCWLGGLEAHKECGCVWPSPSHPRAATTDSFSPPTLPSPSPSDHFPFCRPAGLGRVHLLPIEATRVQLLNLLLHLQTPNPTTSVSAHVCPFKLISSFMRRDTGLGAGGLITSVALNDGGAVVNEKLVDFSPSCSV